MRKALATLFRFHDCLILEGRDIIPQTVVLSRAVTACRARWALPLAAMTARLRRERAVTAPLARVLARHVRHLTPKTRRSWTASIQIQSKNCFNLYRFDAYFFHWNQRLWQVKYLWCVWMLKTKGRFVVKHIFFPHSFRQKIEMFIEVTRGFISVMITESENSPLYLNSVPRFLWSKYPHNIELLICNERYTGRRYSNFISVALLIVKYCT